MYCVRFGCFSGGISAGASIPVETAALVEPVLAFQRHLVSPVRSGEGAQRLVVARLLPAPDRGRIGAEVVGGAGDELLDERPGGARGGQLLRFTGSAGP